MQWGASKNISSELNKLLLEGEADMLVDALYCIKEYIPEAVCITAFDKTAELLGTTECNDEFILDIKEALSSLCIKDDSIVEINYQARAGMSHSVLPLFYGSELIGGLLLEGNGAKVNCHLPKSVVKEISLVVFVYSNRYSSNRPLYIDSESLAYGRGLLIEDLQVMDVEHYSLVYIKVANLSVLTKEMGVRATDQKLRELALLLRQKIRQKIYRVSRDCFACIIRRKDIDARFFMEQSLRRVQETMDCFVFLTVITDVDSNNVFKAMGQCELSVNEKKEGFYIIVDENI